VRYRVNAAGLRATAAPPAPPHKNRKAAAKPALDLMRTGASVRPPARARKLLRRRGQHARDDYDERNNKPEHLRWEGDEVEHGLSPASMSLQVIAGIDAKTAEPGKARYVFSFPASVRHQAIASSIITLHRRFGELSHRLPIIQAH
jgi:hypothetical protein